MFYNIILNMNINKNNNTKNTLSMNQIIEPLVRSCTLDIESMSSIYSNQPIMGDHFAKHQWVEDYNVRMKKKRLISVLDFNLNEDDEDSKFNVEIQKWNDGHSDKHDQISLIERKYTDETYEEITGFNPKKSEWSTEFEEQISNT